MRASIIRDSRKSTDRTSARAAQEAELDVEVSDLTYDRRLSMAARRAADLFDYCSIFSTASLLRQLARAADFEVSAASAVLEAETVPGATVSF